MHTSVKFIKRGYKRGSKEVLVYFYDLEIKVSRVFKVQLRVIAHV